MEAGSQGFNPRFDAANSPKARLSVTSCCFSWITTPVDTGRQLTIASSGWAQRYLDDSNLLALLDGQAGAPFAIC